ncbi:MAG: tRNA (adenosine(37)-N6)-threonylcarbamoyltransferase complex ATPase subunit type 1 TsaE [Myxococcales bacterium]|jgi:tRNA threonylcarbamoyladenosine biosynthesis protein TsaE|nr:tRNA (adenosine(37)-N6)-threonylcarbamoyltransferase complex ATPase subunit type 1 TsaE [Myxococcales bacterium]
MHSARFDLASRRDTRRLGARLASALEPGDLVVLAGELGAGKTFLVRAVARALGVSADVAVTSPTFTLVTEYETAKGTLLHADLYRLRDQADVSAEVARLGLRDRRREGAMVVAEWAEGLEGVLGPADFALKITYAGSNARAVEITSARPLA